MNNIHLVHQIGQQVKSGQMPRGRINVNKGLCYDGRPALQFNYSREAMFSKKMTATEEACRGLIIDPSDGSILALPIPRFYNLGEPRCPKLPDEAYQVFEKIDGCFLGNTKLNLWEGGTVLIRGVVKNRMEVDLIGLDEGGNVVPTRVVDWFDNGAKDKWLLITVDCNVSRGNGMGRYQNNIPITPNHQVLVDNECICACDVRVGDRLTTVGWIPNRDALKVIESGLLGDGCISSVHDSFRYQESHKKEHIGYVEAVSDWLGNCSLRTDEIVSGFGTQMTRVNSRVYRSLEELRKKWYPNGKKVVPEDLTWIDNFAVARWFMDDGSRVHTTKQKDRAAFFTNSFSHEDVKRLAAKLTEMYGVDCTVFNSKGWVIRINAGYNGEIDCFWEAIAPYVVDCMKYKLPSRFRDVSPAPSLKGEEIVVPVEARVLGIKKLRGGTVPSNSDHNYFISGKKGYDVRTTTGNYLAKGVFVHNSLGIYWHDGTSWRCNTRGSFDNPYTAVGLHYWERSIARLYANPNWTIMCEVCVDDDEMARAAYHPEGIYLLAIRDRRTGVDISILSEEAVGLWGQLQIPNLVHSDIDALLDARKMSKGTEGWVIRYKSGLRVKIKTDWYLRVFRAIQSLTPRNVREMMMEGRDWISELPDDIQPKAVEMEAAIAEELAEQLKDIYEVYSKVASISSRKEFAMVVTTQYPSIASYLFALRDGKFYESDVLKKMDLGFLQDLS